MTDASGTKISDCIYAPFGEQVACSPDNASNRYRFTGKEWDGESGLDKFGARYYASSMGRFLSADWSEGPATVPYAHLENPQTLNLYAYVDNNPINGIDEDGHAPTMAGVADSTGDILVGSGISPYLSSSFVGTTEAASKFDPLTYLQKLDAATGPQMATEQGTPHTYDSAKSVDPCNSNACKLADWWYETKQQINGFLCGAYITCSMVPGAIAGDPFVNQSGQWPSFVPADWDVKDTKKSNGQIYIDPKNEHNRIRVMDEGYVKVQKNGQYFDVNGKQVLKDSPEAHIPINAALQELIDNLFSLK
jgi:RHS repeat-associated protein